MLTISTIPEALAELEKQTGRAWTESELFDVATKYGVELHAAPPTGAKTTIEKFVDGVGMIQTIPKMPTMDFDYLMAPCVTTNHPARLAVLFPSQVEQLWLSGEVFTRHSHRHDEVEDETIVFFDPVRVTREQVRIKAATLKKILSVWNMAQAGQGKRYRGPEWMFQAAQPAPAQNTATPAPVEDVGATGEPTGPLPLTTADIAFCFAGLRWDEDGWKKPLGDKPKWLEACIVIPGQRGVSAARWNPVLIGAELVKREYAKLNSVRSKFQTKPLLTPWREEWKTYEADNFDKE